MIDLQFSPLGFRAIDALDLRSGDVVLDVGCSAWQTGDLDAMTSVLLSVGALGKIMRKKSALREMVEAPLHASPAGLGAPPEWNSAPPPGS